jgi:hypothetical protein
VGTYDDAVNSLFAREREDLLSGRALAHHNLAANAELAGALGKRLKALPFGLAN